MIEFKRAPLKDAESITKIKIKSGTSVLDYLKKLTPAYNTEISFLLLNTLLKKFRQLMIDVK